MSDQLLDPGGYILLREIEYLEYALGQACILEERG